MNQHMNNNCSRDVDEAADVLRTVLTPFFLDIASASQIAANSQAKRSLRTPTSSEPLQVVMPRFKSLLLASTAWYQQDSSTGLTSKSTVRLLRERGRLLDACFTATAALLKDKVSLSTVTQWDFYVLDTAFNALQAWEGEWPSGHLLCHPQRLASLANLLGSALKLSRNIAWAAGGPQAMQLVSQVVRFSYFFVNTIQLLPLDQVHSTLTTLPATLLPSIFHMLDEQMYSLVRDSKFGFIQNIIVLSQRLVARVSHQELSFTSFLSPALLGFARHALVRCVSGQLPASATEQITPEQLAHVQNCALALLYADAKFKQVSAQPKVNNTPSSSSSSSKGHNNRSMSDTGSDHLSAVAQSPTVSDSDYFRVLCRCTASCEVVGASGSCMYANLLLQTVLGGWQSSADASIIVLEEPQREHMLGLLRLLTRQAQLRSKAVADWRLHQQQQMLPRHRMISADNQAVESLFVHTCHIIMVLTGCGVYGRYLEEFGSMFSNFTTEGTFLNTVVTWLASSGSAATVEALLRDPNLRGTHINQHSVACIALMVISSFYDASHSALPARISLAATLRKLMHPASAPMWETVGPSPCAVWGQNVQTSGGVDAAEQCTAVIAALGRRKFNFCSMKFRSQDSKPSPSAIASPLGDSRLSFAPHTVVHTIQLSSILAATRVQLCLCTGNEALGPAANTNPPDFICAASNSLLTARFGGSGSTSVTKAKLMASTWERFAISHLPGRLLPGCSHWGCTNLEGPSEAALPTRLCGGCRRARYCCDGCQRAAWVGGHREVCDLALAQRPFQPKACATRSFEDIMKSWV